MPNAVHAICKHILHTFANILVASKITVHHFKIVLIPYSFNSLTNAYNQE